MNKQYTIGAGQYRKDSQGWDGETFGNHDPEIYETVEAAESEFESALQWVKANAPAYDYICISCEDLETGLSENVKTVKL